MAVRCQKYKDRPLIGKISKVAENKITLAWYIGTYSGVWKAWKGRKSTPITDEISLDNIVRKITFTKSMRLPQSVIQSLKQEY